MQSSQSQPSFGVQPEGNRFSSDCPDIRCDSLGKLHVLSDNALLDLLFSLFSAYDLANLSRVSKVFFVFTHQDELWKTLCLSQIRDDFNFQVNWRTTMQHMLAPGSTILPAPDIQARGFFSDELYLPVICTNVDLKAFTKRDNIDRRVASSFSYHEFVRGYSQPNRPVLISGATEGWAAHQNWTKDNLISRYGNVRFSVGECDVRLADYIRYCERTTEERPIYLFDKQFGEKDSRLLSDYTPPSYWSEDFFDVLQDISRPSLTVDVCSATTGTHDVSEISGAGAGGSVRPPFRWWLVGPPRSGSTFHKDPLLTSAWNACIHGAKKWIMFPPNHCPPGCFPSDDGVNVTTPLSATEWLVNFYESSREEAIAAGAIECIQRAGDVVFIPCGWYHMVVNLEFSVAVTQNVVDAQNLPKVLRFLADSADYVSAARSDGRGTEVVVKSESNPTGTAAEDDAKATAGLLKRKLTKRQRDPGTLFSTCSDD
jgi:hypothetical protein